MCLIILIEKLAKKHLTSIKKEEASELKSEKRKVDEGVQNDEYNNLGLEKYQIYRLK